MRICEQHQKIVPLLSTMAFAGAEYWCPFCGYQGGVLEAGKEVFETVHLTELEEKWRDHARAFLHATGAQICCSLIHEGERMKPEDLPDNVKAEHKRIIADWQYGQKI